LYAYEKQLSRWANGQREGATTSERVQFVGYYPQSVRYDWSFCCSGFFRRQERARWPAINFESPKSVYIGVRGSRKARALFDTYSREVVFI